MAASHNQTSAQQPSQGTFNDFRYEIADPNGVTATVKISIPHDQTIKAIPGCMLATSPNIEIKGKLKKTMRAMFGPDEARHQTFTANEGEGWVLLAPPFLGSICAIQLQEEEVCVGDNAFLASFGDVKSTSVRQGLKKAFTSGHGLFVKKVSGTGVVLVYAVGSMREWDLAEGEEIIVDNGHLVTWRPTIKYDVQKAAKGWFGTGLSGEGLVSRITGPGQIQIQTRNPEEMVEWIYETKAPPAS